MRTLTGLNLTGKTVLVRVDFNVPQDKSGRITDDSRLKAHLPTLAHLTKAGARVLLVSHLGRPKGPTAEFTLKPVAEHLSKLMGAPVAFVPDCVGPVAQAARAALKNGDVALLENVRFYPQEEANDPAFAQQLAALCDVYVNDAFGTAHRAHASTAGIAAFVKEKAVGLLMQKELDALDGVFKHPRKPVVIVIGGSKISSKIGILRHLVPKADAVIIGGAMANTFLLAQGHGVGASLAEPDQVPTAKDILALAAQHGCTLHLPTDVTAATAFAANAPHRTAAVTDIKPGEMALDVGPATSAAWDNVIAKAGTVLWNGPVGAFETTPFDRGTRAMAKAIAASDAYSVAGGGDTLSAIAQSGVGEGFSYISTGGGSLLEYLEGLELPGVKAVA
jgi:phosphoglycerate kinase